MFAVAAVLLNVDAAFGCSSKAKAYVTLMRSDLRNIVSSQADYRAAHGHYATNLEALDFKSSIGVARPTMRFTGDVAFSVATTHAELNGGCLVYVGPKPAGLKAPADIAEGDPWCEDVESKTVDRSQQVFAYTGILLIALTLATAFFLKVPNRRNWPGVALLVVTFLYFGVARASCVSVPPEPPLVLLLAGLGLFSFALWRRVGGGPFAS